MNLNQRRFADSTVRKRLQGKNYFLIMQLITKIWSWGERIVAMLGGRTIAMLFAALAIAFGSVMFSDNWIMSISRQVEVIRAVRINIAVLNELKANLFEAESAQRGYMLTKRKEYIAPFNSALEQARANIELSEALVKATSSEKNQTIELEWLKEISASVEAKSAEMLLTLKLMEQNKIVEANEVVNLDIGRQQMQKFIIATDKLIQQQTADANEMIEKRKATVNLARASGIIASLVLILLVVMVIKQLLNELLAKSKLQQQVVQENADYQVKLKQQTMLLRSMALDYQADVERERQKLSRELHDELGSIFTATKMDLAWCMKKLAETAPEVASKLAKTIGYVDQGIQYQRHIVQELHPSMISTFGFWPALTVLIKDAAERNKWQLTLNLPEQTTVLNETISLVAYRIVQESLNNANKYAKASAVTVDLMLDDKHLKLEIQDNGVGADMNALDGNTHGLSGMRHRVLAIGGHFEILSEPTKGMLTRVLIPLDVVANQ
jgi:signal transduction histidine kinase